MSRLNVDQIYTRTGTGTPALREMPVFSVRKQLSDQNLAVSNTLYLVTYDTIESDTNSWWDSDNNRYTPQIAGWYQINVSTGGAQTSSPNEGRLIANLRKNGTDVFRTGYGDFYARVNITAQGSCLVYLNGSTDYIEVFALILGATPLTIYGSSDPTATYFSGFLVRPD